MTKPDRRGGCQEEFQRFPADTLVHVLLDLGAFFAALTAISANRPKDVGDDRIQLGTTCHESLEQD